MNLQIQILSRKFQAEIDFSNVRIITDRKLNPLCLSLVKAD